MSIATCQTLTYKKRAIFRVKPPADSMLAASNRNSALPSSGQLLTEYVISCGGGRTILEMAQVLHSLRLSNKQVQRPTATSASERTSHHLRRLSLSISDAFKRIV
jgi:hypothetical protein